MPPVRLGIRREDKNHWERRVALSPDAVRSVVDAHAVEVLVQPSTTRIFDDASYAAAGARIEDDLSSAELIFAVKEIPIELIEEGRRYLLFSHTIKGQSYNMPLLRRMIERKVTLVDYECIADDQGRRLVFFGRHAGYAGMIDTLTAYGDRLRWEGHESIFSAIRSAHEYRSLEHARAELGALGAEDRPEPVIVGFTGYGNVSQGAQSILDLLPTEELDPASLLDPERRRRLRPDRIHKVVFYEKHMFQRADGGEFELQDYFDHPELYRSCFERFLPHLSILVNAIFWNDRCPRLVTKDYLRRAWPAGDLARLKVIGDISIDIEGAIECSVKATESDQPCYVYDPRSGVATDGVAGDGPVIMAVDNLPCEIPRESSETFSAALSPFLPALVAADWSRPFDSLDLPAPIKRATILHHGELTPDYRFMERFL